VQVPEEVLDSDLQLLLRSERPVQHIRHFWEQDGNLLTQRSDHCLIFLSNLKGVASDWFYSLPPRSLNDSEEVAEAFLTQYASRREAKKNNYHLLSVNMRQSDSLKSYISFFQCQLAKVRNCGEDVSVLAFISGLQVSHLMYKHLLKHNVTQMSEVLSRA